MKNKILIELILPELDKRYDIYIPTNKRILNIVNLINKSIIDLNNGEYTPNPNHLLYNRETGEALDYKLLVSESNIRNGSILILL